VPPGCAVFLMSADVRDPGRTHMTPLSVVGGIQTSLRAMKPLLAAATSVTTGAYAALLPEATSDQQARRRELASLADSRMQAAVIAPMARPSRRRHGTHISISPQALWTAAHEELPVTLVVMNNREFDVLKTFMKAQAGYASARNNRFVAMKIGRPAIDFLALAQSMGVPARTANRTSDIAPALETGIASGQEPDRDQDQRSLICPACSRPSAVKLCLPAPWTPGITIRMYNGHASTCGRCQFT
jgi:Thiamine pyrophosphate enzyme, C-terminal TPP binding domain